MAHDAERDATHATGWETCKNSNRELAGPRALEHRRPCSLQVPQCGPGSAFRDILSALCLILSPLVCPALREYNTTASDAATHAHHQCAPHRQHSAPSQPRTPALLVYPFGLGSGSRTQRWTPSGPHSLQPILRHHHHCPQRSATHLRDDADT